MRWSLGLVLGFGLVASASAEVPQQLHYNGYLTNAVGEAVDCPDTVQCGETFDLTYALYDGEDAEVPMWTETHVSAPIYGGSFHSILGAETPITPEILSGSMWLSVQINQNAELLPRQRLAAAAYAIKAGTVDYAHDAAQLGGLAPGEYATGPHTIDTDTHLTEEQVDAMVANNDYATGPHTVDTNTQLTEEQVDAMVVNNGYAQEAQIIETQANLVQEAADRTAADLAIQTQLDAAGVPTGVIVMWSGSIGAVPTGWALCDGNSGAPDLRDRFVVGAGSSYSVGATGGPTGGVSQSKSTAAHWGSNGLSVVTNVSGGAGVPPYFALAYIMKL